MEIICSWWALNSGESSFSGSIPSLTKQVEWPGTIALAIFLKMILHALDVKVSKIGGTVDLNSQCCILIMMIHKHRVQQVDLSTLHRLGVKKIVALPTDPMLIPSIVERINISDGILVVLDNELYMGELPHQSPTVMAFSSSYVHEHCAMAQSGKGIGHLETRI
jgi:hypothetical protein